LYRPTKPVTLYIDLDIILLILHHEKVKMPQRLIDYRLTTSYFPTPIFQSLTYSKEGGGVENRELRKFRYVKRKKGRMRESFRDAGSREEKECKISR
jgi:hypothetical protein